MIDLARNGLVGDALSSFEGTRALSCGKGDDSWFFDNSE